MIEINKIHNINCFEGLNLIDNNSIDLIITSPPYNLGGKFHTGNTKHNKAYDIYDDNIKESDYQKQQVEFLDLCFEKLCENGSIFYNHKPRIKNRSLYTPS